MAGSDWRRAFLRWKKITIRCKTTVLQALTQIEQILHEFQIENVSLFDHDPCLTDTGLGYPILRVPLQLRETLVERIKPLGYRFVAIDLDEA